ncbi:restriction endonuclease subunit S [Bacillus velezensis]|nr:restriction endonuclease subunit S [Bacillus velezensis]
MKKGDLLIEKSGGGEKQPVGFVVQYNLDKKALYANFMAKIELNSQKVDSTFMNYVFSSLYGVKANIKAFNQTTGIQNLNTSVYLNEVFMYPSLNVQKNIVNFLNKKIQTIDEIINKKQKMVGLLKVQRQSIITEAVTKGLNPNVEMKGSGVKWIGEVPEHWDIKKVKYLIQEKLSYGANESAELDDENLPRYIRITDIDELGKLKKETFKSLPLEIANKYVVKKGDVLLARSGATVGKSYIHKEEKEASYAGYLIKLRARTLNLAEYIYYYTNSSLYKQWINSILIQATIQNVSAEKYANLSIPVPNNENEIKSIVSHIKLKEKELLVVIDKLNEQIEKMKEYRQSLIYEAVAGKIDVRDMELDEVR